MPIAPDQLPDEPQALKRIIAAMAQDALAAQAEIARLKFQLARDKRAEFGRSLEKLAREAEQLELTIESLEEDQPGRVDHQPRRALAELLVDPRYPQIGRLADMRIGRNQLVLGHEATSR